jgi:hypothetical protein
MRNSKCRFHGGKSTGPNPTHGRRVSPNNPARIRLSERAAKFAAMADPLDLNTELAFCRALFSEWLDQHDATELEPSDRTQALEIIGATGALIERVERIRNATALTQAEVKYLHARIADLLIKYLEPEKRLAFLAELRQATGARDEQPPTVPVALPTRQAGNA